MEYKSSAWNQNKYSQKKTYTNGQPAVPNQYFDKNTPQIDQHTNATAAAAAMYFQNQNNYDYNPNKDY